MRFKQDVAGCLATRIGDHGLADAALAGAVARTGAARAELRARRADGSLPLLHLPAARDDLGAPGDLAARYAQSFAEVVLLGTGGSSLGGQTLVALADRGFGPRRGRPALRFLDNVDPDTFEALLETADPGRTGFLVVSKSGGTAETLCQFLICLEHWRERVGEDALRRHFAVVTEPKDNPLRRIATRFALPVLDHDPGVGGRFSALSLVGLLPAMIAGLDAVAVRAGAAAVLDPALGGGKDEDCPPALGAALSVALAQERGIGTTVLMPYVDRLGYLGFWYRQLWAESLGKKGRGTTPVRALGTVDQHSQLQLYLDGPRDKMFTLVLADMAGRGRAVAPALAAEPELGYLAGRTMGDLLDAEGRATAATLIGNRRPTRILQLGAVDEGTLGALMMHFMLETIIAAHLLGVDPFDQPAVEEGKVLTRRYLAQGRGAR